jgi:glutamate-1-semialdehyde 2,1-aminomutase
LHGLTERETRRFVELHPGSRRLHQRALQSLVSGVPMPWMARWAGGFPIYAAHATGARITDVDGHSYLDFCLGDSGAMGGHSPQALVRATQDRIADGITMMLPTEDAIWVGEELARRFGVSRQFTLTATDSNRCALRLCRQITGRRKVLVLLSRHGGRGVRGPGPRRSYTLARGQRWSADRSDAPVLP